LRSIQDFNMNAPEQSPQNEKLASDIRRELGRDRTARFLRTVPAFKIATDTPDYLRQLLDRLEKCEAPAENRLR